MSAERVTLASRLRAARPHGGASPGSPASSSPSDSRSGDPVVPMATPLARPTLVSISPTSLEFHNDATVWTSTPVRASQRSEFIEKLDYAFAYGEELAKLLRAHGFKANVGISLDGPDAETDFAVLLANMSHVLGPISRDEVFKLLDLDYEYEAYHYVINELIYAVLPTVLRGMALSLYDESTRVHPHDGRCALQRLRFYVEGIGDPDAHRFWVRLRATKIDETLEPAPQLAVVRTLADKHRRLHPAYSDRDLVEDVYYAILRSSASASPYITPLYLVVLRELGTAHGHTFASLTLRLGKIFRDESHLARLSAPASGGATGGGGGGRSSVGAIYNMGKRKPCITCFRLWAVTTGHIDTEGICPYVCTQTFAPGRAPAKAPTAPANPPPLSEWPPSAAPRAHALRELEPPMQDEDAPAAAAAMHHVRLSSDQPLGGDVRLSTGWTPGFAGLPHAGNGDCEPPISTLAIRQHMDDDEEDWPAFRESPVYIPSKASGNH
ncbi:hypothetical protein CYMTET_52518 [Cymbomonas tetramitiformis]|uniref:Uncharacterized protein n=1 Tax=Cymbomonas tetramitiformis TaxID=36881 RepID=A0AAE0BK61_9CHLO|nr:hypothetical protein CYMTET_52518 [Cymbomonas tetramitiformis]